MTFDELIHKHEAGELPPGNLTLQAWLAFKRKWVQPWSVPSLFVRHDHIDAPVAKLDNAPGCNPGVRRFESDPALPAEPTSEN